LHRNRGEQAEPALGRRIPPFGGQKSTPPRRTEFEPPSARSPSQKRRDETIFPPHVVVLKQSRDVVAARTMGGRVMSIIKNDSAGSESWDPALWSIGTVLGAAIVYLACLT
jgi:hypothetical protein